MKKLSFPQVDALLNFLNNRNPREKKMILILGGVFLLVMDYFFWISPVSRVFSELSPKIQPLQQQLNELKDDSRNKTEIAKKWEIAKHDLSEKDKMFVDRDGTPALLENLSKLAQKSGVKIISLEPFEGAKPSSAKGNYAALPIQVKAIAGTHELGSFLSNLESGDTYFKIKDLKISVNPLNERKHNIELSMEAFRREK